MKGDGLFRVIGLTFVNPVAFNFDGLNYSAETSL